MLFNKVMGKFENHYKHGLLPVADGTFDGVYSQLFKETSYKSIEGKGTFTKNHGQNIIFLLRI